MITEKILDLGFKKVVTNGEFTTYKKSFKGEYNYTCVATIYHDNDKKCDFLFHHQNSSGCYLRKHIGIVKVRQLLKALF